MVRELARAKVDAVKVVVDDVIVKVPALSDAVMSALVDETHRTGLIQRAGSDLRTRG